MKQCKLFLKLCLSFSPVRFGTRVWRRLHYCHTGTTRMSEPTYPTFMYIISCRCWHIRPYSLEYSGSRLLPVRQTSEGQISSWVGDDQRTPAVVCFLLSFCRDWLFRKELVLSSNYRWFAKSR